MRKIIAFLSVFLLTGCVGNPPRPNDIVQYDLGDLSGAWTATDLPIAAVEVRVGTGLDSPAQLYRLSYVDDLRRRTYVESRWGAPPAELIERFLQRRIVFGQPDFSGPGCRLSLVLDELEQRFDTPQVSKIVLEARVSLLPLHGETLLSKRAFLIKQPAPTPDARGGVVATRAAALALANELAQWLNEVVRERPQAVAACKERS